MKRVLLLLFILVASAIALAHEFWFHSQKFFYNIRETANIRFVAGEHFTGENWKGNKDKIVQLFHYTPSENIIDISSRLSANPGDSLQLPLQEEGTHMIIFNSTNSFIKQDAEKFNAYLKEDGLDNVYSYRKEHGEEKAAGTEHYQRSIKTILQVSGKITNACTEPTGLPLDIIPSENPYSVPITDVFSKAVKVKFKILFSGKPLPNALVKIWYHTRNGQTGMDSLYTNKNGMISAERHTGAYMLSCVYMERNSAGNEADWQSYRGSLSFEYSQFFPGNKSR
jgi:uncharacterized GH25 family protein